MNWMPKISFGPLRFDAKLDVENLPFSIVLVDEYDNQKIFQADKVGLRFTVEEGVLVSVESYLSVNLGGTEIVGMDFDALKIFLRIGGKECVERYHEPFGRELECPHLGAIFWEEDGRLESVSMSS